MKTKTKTKEKENNKTTIQVTNKTRELLGKLAKFDQTLDSLIYNLAMAALVIKQSNEREE